MTGSSLWAESVAVWLLCAPYSSLVFSIPVGHSLCLPRPASLRLLLVCGPLLVILVVFGGSFLLLLVVGLLLGFAVSAVFAIWHFP